MNSLNNLELINIVIFTKFGLISNIYRNCILISHSFNFFCLLIKNNITPSTTLKYFDILDYIKK